MRTIARAALASTVALLFAAGSEGASRREVRAVRTTSPPAIDGEVGEAVWSLAPPITGLEQQRPDNGQPSSEAIRIHVLFDDDAIYVGAVMKHERSPVIRLLARRDTFLDSDWFGIMLDTQYDRRSALGFFVNPEGVQLDEAVTDDNVEDYDWDGTWQSAAKVLPDGWSAEIRIPLTQLRFVEKEKQVWGVQFIRWVRARQEQARLVSNPRDRKGFVSQFGDLVGVDGIRPRPKLELQPYTSTAAVRNGGITAPDPFSQRAQTLSEAGLDLRWTTRSSTTVYATLNPDFGQVEVDPAVLNLSEFELFFPEKRPFFVEGAKLFNFGNVATSYSSPFRPAQPVLFYSRRIGREPQLNAGIRGEFLDLPSSTRILGAAKVTGRTAGGTTFSIIDALTGKEHAHSWQSGSAARTLVQPGTNFFAGRATKDFGAFSRLGVLVTSVLRDAHHDTVSLPESAAVAGVDGYSYLAKGNVLVDWMIAASRVRGDAAAIRALQLAPAHSYQRPDAGHVELDPARTSLDGWGAKLSVSRETGTWRYNAGVQRYTPGFDLNELGFHARGDLEAAHAQVTWYDVVKRSRTRNNRVTLGYYRSGNGDGDVLANGLTVQHAATYLNWWTSSATASVAFATIDDRETRGGPAIAKPPGWSTQLRLGSNTARRFWFDLARSDAGDDNGGSTQLTQLTLAVRPRTNITAQLAVTHAATVTASKFVSAVADENAATFGRRYVFGRLLERRIEVAPRLDWTIRRTLTLQVYLQPLAAAGTYSALGELERSRGSYSPYQDIVAIGGAYGIDPDGPGPEPRFTIASPDFTFRSFRGNAVLRWEVGPATLFAIWNEGRQLRAAETTAGRAEDLRSIGEIPAEDRFLVKVSYRFEFPR